MNKDIPIYEISIDLFDDETTVSFNSLVELPAHEKNFMMFAKQMQFEINEEEQIITGIAISADTPIYRFDQNSMEEYYVVFKKNAIKDIIFDYARKENFNNVNIEHNAQNVVEGIYMVHSYQIDNDKGFTAPERFKDANDGSWIVSYKVTDKEIFEQAKAGKFNGFSIEGVFNLLDAKEEQQMSIIFDELFNLSNHIKKKKKKKAKNKQALRLFNDYPESVSNNAKRGIELNDKNGNKCATRIGRLRATTLAKRGNVSVEIIKRMYSYLSRAEVYYDENNTTACGTISFLLWGGKSALSWSRNKLKELGEIK